jgi:tRNA-Thr(GGU) m(6)t(6)A37 methyltransferase TsaA
MNAISYIPIGVIRSPFQTPAGMPVQSVAAKGVAGMIELAPTYQDGLQDLEGFSHLFLLYHLHLVRRSSSLMVTPFLDDQPRGVFATRAPQRPNPIGLSVVRLVRVAGTQVYIEDVDVVDGTPLLDMKPYIPAFDVRATTGIGWYAQRLDQVDHVRADQRFSCTGQ